MATEEYKFQLRKDMPKGFVRNEQYPELPAIYSFLEPHDGTVFDSIEKFKELLAFFPDYLEGSDVPVGEDPLLRDGLKVEESSEGISGIGDYFVFTPATNGPGRCVFGGLEIVTTE